MSWLNSLIKMISTLESYLQYTSKAKDLNDVNQWLHSMQSSIILALAVDNLIVYDIYIYIYMEIIL